MYNTITVYNTAAAAQTRYRTNAQTFSMFSCSAAINHVVYRVVGSGNSSSAVIEVGDFLYTNSAGTSPLAASNYGIQLLGFGSASHQITVTGSNGFVNSVLACSGGGGPGNGGDGPQR